MTIRVETWLTAPPEEALRLQRPLNEEKLKMVEGALAGDG